MKTRTKYILAGQVMTCTAIALGLFSFWMAFLELGHDRRDPAMLALYCGMIGAAFFLWNVGFSVISNADNHKDS